jgi:hypothetical protein
MGMSCSPSRQGLTAPCAFLPMGRQLKRLVTPHKLVSQPMKQFRVRDDVG